MPASPSTTCCEAAPRSGPDASSAPAAASLCCAPYEGRLLAPGRAELNAALGMYSAPYAAGQGYGNYLPYGAEPAALYTALVSARPPPALRRGGGCNRRQKLSCSAVGVGPGDHPEGRGITPRDVGPGAGPARRGWGARRDSAAAGSRGCGARRGSRPARRQTLPASLAEPSV